MTWRGRSCHECQADGRPWYFSPRIRRRVVCRRLRRPDRRARRARAAGARRHGAPLRRRCGANGRGGERRARRGAAAGPRQRPFERPAAGHRRPRSRPCSTAGSTAAANSLRDLRPHLTVDPASASDADLIAGRLPGMGPRRTGAPARRLRVVPLGRPRAPARVCARSFRRPPALLRAHLRAGWPCRTRSPACGGYRTSPTGSSTARWATSWCSAIRRIRTTRCWPTSGASRPATC